MSTSDRMAPWAVRLRMERARRGWSRNDLAHHLRQAAQALGIALTQNAASLARSSRRWESGEVLPDWRHQVLLAAAYGLRVADLFGDAVSAAVPNGVMVASGGTVELPHFVQAEDDPMERRNFMSWLGALAASGAVVPDSVRDVLAASPDRTDLLSNITMQDVERLDTANRMFMEWEHTVGGGLSRRAVVGQLSWAMDHLEAGVRGTPDALDAWRVTTMRLASTAGWMAHDAGRPQQARSLLLLGYKVASMVEDTHVGDPARAFLLSQLAQQAIENGRPRTGLDLIRHAQGIADDATPTTKSKLRAVKARACGALGANAETRRELELADEEFAQISKDDLEREPWAWCAQTTAQRHFNIGAARHLLMRADPETASDDDAVEVASAFTASAAAWGEGGKRSEASALLRASAALMAGREPEQAVAVARRTLPALPALRSQRVREDVHDLKATAAPYRRRSDVDALVHELHAAV